MPNSQVFFDILKYIVIRNREVHALYKTFLYLQAYNLFLGYLQKKKKIKYESNICYKTFIVDTEYYILLIIYSLIVY